MKMKISGEKCRHMIAKYESAMVENKMLELSNQEASGENRKIANALRNERNHIAQLADHVGYIFHVSGYGRSSEINLCNFRMTIRY